jgi:hypothetical protein
MGFLDNYEDVNSRIKRFRTEFPSGRLVAFIEHIDIDKGTILVRAEAYREYEDTVPSAVDYAFGNVATLPQNMKKWFIEDCLTSAYGRVIGLLTPSDGGRPTSQDMEKVEASYANSEPDPWAVNAAKEGIPTIATAMATIQAGLGGVLPAEAPRCPHGTMIWAEGTSSKTGKAWAAYRCTEKTKATQCSPLWHVLASDGKWKPQV